MTFASDFQRRPSDPRRSYRRGASDWAEEMGLHVGTENASMEGDPTLVQGSLFGEPVRPAPKPAYIRALREARKLAPTYQARQRLDALLQEWDN